MIPPSRLVRIYCKIGQHCSPSPQLFEVIVASAWMHLYTVVVEDIKKIVSKCEISPLILFLNGYIMSCNPAKQTSSIHIEYVE